MQLCTKVYVAKFTAKLHQNNENFKRMHPGVSSNYLDREKCPSRFLRRYVFIIILYESARRRKGHALKFRHGKNDKVRESFPALLCEFWRARTQKVKLFLFHYFSPCIIRVFFLLPNRYVLFSISPNSIFATWIFSIVNTKYRHILYHETISNTRNVSSRSTLSARFNIAEAQRVLTAALIKLSLARCGES